MVSGGQNLPPIGCRVVMNATSTLTLLGRRPCQYRAGANAQPAWTSHLTSSSADATFADCCVRMRTSLATSDFLRFGENYRTGTVLYRVPVKRHRGEPGHTRDMGQTRGAEPHNHPNPPTHPPTRATAGRPNPRPTQRPQPPEPTAPRGRLRPEAAPRPPPANPVPVPSATPTADNAHIRFSTRSWCVRRSVYCDSSPISSQLRVVRCRNDQRESLPRVPTEVRSGGVRMHTPVLGCIHALIPGIHATVRGCCVRGHVSLFRPIPARPRWPCRGTLAARRIRSCPRTLLTTASPCQSKLIYR